MSALRTLLQMTLDGVEAYPTRDVLTFVSLGRDGELQEEIRTPEDLLSRATAIAGALQAAGLREGESFAISMRNHPEFVDAMIASEIAGTIFVPIDHRMRGRQLIYLLSFSECRGAIVTADVARELTTLRDDLPLLKWVWVIDAHEDQGSIVSLPTALSRASRPASIKTRPLDQPMQMLFTSGTTGDPKAILAPYSRYAGFAARNEAIGLTRVDRPYTGLSLTHANAQLITLGNAMSMGLRLVISRQFTKTALWRLLAHYECTTFNLLGGMATAIAAEPPSALDRQHKVRFVLSAGMPASLWQTFEERFGLRIFEFFATAEGGLTLNPPGAGPIGSVGKPPPELVCEILDDDGAPVAASVEGELCFKPIDRPADPVRYFKNPEASAEKTRGGWFHTGDIGFKDADGWVYYSYRAGDSIRRNGEFINAAALMVAIIDSPDVADAYVYGYRTDKNAPGEKYVVAAVVPKEGTSPDPSAVVAHCADALGRPHALDFIQYVSAIPKTASEKPQDRKLIGMLESGESTVFQVAANDEPKQVVTAR